MQWKPNSIQKVYGQVEVILNLNTVVWKTVFSFSFLVKFLKRTIEGNKGRANEESRGVKQFVVWTVWEKKSVQSVNSNVI